MYTYGPPHMDGLKQDDQLEHTDSSYVRIRDVALKTCQRWWTMGKSGERGSGISVLAARDDDGDDNGDDDDIKWLKQFKLRQLSTVDSSLIAVGAMIHFALLPSVYDLEDAQMSLGQIQEVIHREYQVNSASNSPVWFSTFMTHDVNWCCCIVSHNTRILQSFWLTWSRGVSSWCNG